MKGWVWYMARWHFLVAYREALCGVNTGIKKREIIQGTPPEGKGSVCEYCAQYYRWNKD